MASSLTLPSHHRAFTMTADPSGAKPGAVWHPAKLVESPVPSLPSSPPHVLIRVSAVAFNHRDVWIRKGLYPGISFPSVLGSDCVGTVVAASDPSSPLLQKEIVPYPAVNWLESKKAPDVAGKRFAILGGSGVTEGRGTFGEYLVVPEDFCVEKPSHLTNPSAAALPLGSLTAWRAVTTKGEVEEGMNVLVTGIGGGVALLAMQIALAKGAKVWVTSGSVEKIEKAKKLGAQGGVNYKDSAWPKQLKELLPKERPLIDVVIDGAGGDITKQVGRLMVDGGIISCYGVQTGTPLSLSIAEVLKNIELRGTSMGSLAEFKQVIQFIADKQIEPVVHQPVLEGLEKLDEGFEIMKKGEQFGKIVVSVDGEGLQGSGTSKL